MWASSGTVAKALFLKGITPFELVQVRVTLSSALLAILLGTFSRSTLRIRFRDIGYFFLLGGVSMAMVQGTYLYAISKIQVAAAILLQYLAPILVALFSMAVWKEKFTLLKLLSLLLAMSGCYLVVGGYDLDLLRMNRMGILGGLAAAVAFAAYTLLGERGMHRYSPWTVLFYALSFSALTWHVLYPPFHYVTARFDPIQWSGILYIAVLGTLLPFGLFFVGVGHIRSTRASITATLEPISSGFMAFVFLGESMTPLQILGGMLVVGAIVLLQLRQEGNEWSPERIRKRGGGSG